MSYGSFLLCDEAGHAKLDAYYSPHTLSEVGAYLQNHRQNFILTLFPSLKFADPGHNPLNTFADPEGILPK